MSRSPTIGPRSSAHLAGLLLVGIACACGSGEDFASGRVQVRDSAGVRIVESAAPAWGEEPGWLVGSDPLLEIGGTGSAEEFFEIRDLARLSDGRIAVLNGGSSSVRVYDADGEPLGELGEPGDGPGELRYPTMLHATGGDTLLVWDRRRPGVSIYVIGNGHLSTRMLAPIAGGQLGDVHPLPTGALVVLTYVSPVTAGRIAGPGIYRYDAPLLVVAPAGAVDTIGSFPSSELMVAELGAGTPPFMKATHVAARGDEVTVGTADRGEVRVLGSNGRLRSILRFDAGDLAVTDEDRAWYVERVTSMASTPEQRRELEVMTASLLYPDTRAAYSNLLADPTGAVWLRTGRTFSRTPGLDPEWTILAHDGAWLGTLRLPERFVLMEVGEDYLLGTWRDELGIESVRLYGLERDAGAS